MAFLLGAVVGVFLISSVVRVVAFRKMEEPKKHYYSILIAWMMATAIAGFGMANGGDPQFVKAGINYGIASIILVATHLLIDLVKKPGS